MPSALSMADAGSHAALLLTQLAAALAGFLDSHAFLQVVTDPESREGCKMGFLVIASTNPHHAWLRHGFRSCHRQLRPGRGPAAGSYFSPPTHGVFPVKSGGRPPLPA